MRGKILKFNFSRKSAPFFRNCSIKSFNLVAKKDNQKICMLGGPKSLLFNNTKGSRFGLLRFGSVLKSKQRFGRFKVRFSEVRGSEFSGSFQV